jgi:protein involved in polysaccharide export with SLBB domain
MKVKNMNLKLTVKITYGFALWLVSLSLLALTSTAAQIEQIKSLPKAQQEALAKQYGYDLSSISGMGGAAKPDIITTPIVVQPLKASSLNNPAVLAIEKSVIETTQSLNKTEDTEARMVRQPLKQFGYDLFAGSPTTFAPATDIPVPLDYVMGPGDSVKIKLFGTTSGEYEITVDREGNLVLPKLGVLSVIGLSFDELKRLIDDEYKQKTIGVQPVITLGSLRSIRIFMLGEVNNPGAFTVSSLSTLTNALFVSGGVSKMGSLRNIQHKRSGNIVTRFDLYELLLKGNTSSDAKLLPGDVIFIPPVGNSVGIRGEVRRPAIFELKENESLNDLLSMAGGYLPTAYPKVSRIERIKRNGDRSIIDVDLTQSEALTRVAFDGDIVEIYSILDRVENVIQLNGHIQRPGAYAWNKGIRVSDLIPKVDLLQPKADLNYALIIREVLPNREIIAKAFDLGKAISNPGSEFDIKLHSRDKIFIFAIESARTSVLKTTIRTLKSQERANSPPKIVVIQGNVRHPGTYPLTNNMKVSDLLKASFELKADTDFEFAVLRRYLHEEHQYKAIYLNLKNESDLNLKLNEQDKLYIFNISMQRNDALSTFVELMSEQATINSPPKIVTIRGNVKFPLTMPMTSGMKLKDLFKASYDFLPETDFNYALIERKIHNQSRIESITLDLIDGNNADFVLQEQDILTVFDVKSPRAMIVADLIDKLNFQVDKKNSANIVSVFGNVKFPGLYPLSKNMHLKQLLAAAGGYTESAYTEMAELTRFDSDLRQTFVKEHQQIDMRELIEQNKTFALQSRDILTIKQIPDWRNSESVLLSGEFKFPGRYEIKRGDTITEIIKRAGGLTSYADPRAFQFSRQSLRAKEEQQIEILKQRLKKDLVNNRIQKSNNEETVASPTSDLEDLAPLFDSLDNRLIKGRLALNLANVMLGKQQDIDLRSGDELFVPMIIQEVSVIGEVQQSTSHVYNPQYDVSDYINVSGGESQYADSSRIYVIKVSGEVKLQGGNNWFGDSNEIEPGDTIVVPLNTDRVGALTLWTGVSQVIYQFGLAAAAVHSLSSP